MVTLPPRYPDRPAFDLVAIVDPVSRGAQKLTPILQVLQQVLNAKVRVFFNPVDKHSEMPNKSYFRVVLEAGPQFGEAGQLLPGPRAAFHNIPEQPILTQNYHVPDNWLVEPIKSVHDLDNIKLEGVENGVSSEWELGSLLVEGHCFESGSGNPPRGLQLNLGTRTTPNRTDTIVMANLGYFQLKADPGYQFINVVVFTNLSWSIFSSSLFTVVFRMSFKLTVFTYCLDKIFHHYILFLNTGPDINLDCISRRMVPETASWAK